MLRAAEKCIATQRVAARPSAPASSGCAANGASGDPCQQRLFLNEQAGLIVADDIWNTTMISRDDG